ncbi:hypothetical protein KSC_110460 [Ktedonobacter sp. SOSP1-52]|nr:hypothetical protein KSC_110460 [Ktedonobacter sp. SOSP1-52]
MALVYHPPLAVSLSVSPPAACLFRHGGTDRDKETCLERQDKIGARDDVGTSKHRYTWGQVASVRTTRLHCYLM